MPHPNPLHRIESASTEELVQLFRNPSSEEEAYLREYYGNSEYNYLRRVSLRGERASSRGNAVVLHGIMGSALSLQEPPDDDRLIWIHIWRLIRGELESLGVTPDFHSDKDIAPAGILKRWYSRLLLELRAGGWNVQAFAYDWRLDLDGAADSLSRRVDQWFGPDEPVNLIAHSMGGLVSRSFIRRYPERWAKGGHLIMLGTPNHGSFSIPQVITGALPMVRKLAILDLDHSTEELTRIFNGMPGIIQMLPSPYRMPEMKRLYQSDTWNSSGVTPKILELALSHHGKLADVVDGNRMHYIAGFDEVTKCGVADWSKLDSPSGYVDTLDGDGSVPHKLGFLEEDGQRIPTYFVRVKHGALPNHPEVIEATQQILETGTCDLPSRLPASRSLSELTRKIESARESERVEEETVSRLAIELRNLSKASSPGDLPPGWRETRARDIVVDDFLSGTAPVSRDGSLPTPTPGIPFTAPSLEVRLVHGEIEKSDILVPDCDALAVGAYVNVLPNGALAALDRAIQGDRDNEPVIRSLIEKRMIGGGLGQNFVIPDPRKPGRIIVIAGMGQPGECGEAELTILAQNLFWMLDRMECRHLCTVLIGGGEGNLKQPKALRAWLNGAARALGEISRSGRKPVLSRLTFIEYFAANFLFLNRALEKAAGSESRREKLEISYSPPPESDLIKITEKAEAIAVNMAKQKFRKALDLGEGAEASRPGSDGNGRATVRMTVRLTGDSYEFAALTHEASVPKREIEVDPGLIEEVCQDLVSGGSPDRQANSGHLLSHLLLPRDFRRKIFQPSAPIVATVDRSTARIPWEMMATGVAGEGIDQPALGTQFGLTRQFLTPFAPLPDLLTSTGTTLKVLIIADPAENAPLPGAMKEGDTVLNHFERFRKRIRERGTGDVEIVSLLGPREATRVEVMGRLIRESFDILHFAGHCHYDAMDPSRSGWVFSGDTILSARELNRVDRVPRFVFSNACESGVTPHHWSPAPAPSFAEAYFARGVRNFVCTAWPVDDRAALTFANTFYEKFLGDEKNDPAPLHQCMTEARRRTAMEGEGGCETWGAYQHYGDPHFQLNPATERPRSAPRKKKSRKAKTKSARSSRKTRKK